MMETIALRRIADLPGPRGAPLIGNLLQIDAPRMHHQLEQWCREFGPFFKLQMGRRKLLIVGDHEAVATTLRDRPEGFKRTVRVAASSAISTVVIFNETGAAPRTMPTAQSPAAIPARIASERFNIRQSAWKTAR